MKKILLNMASSAASAKSKVVARAIKIKNTVVFISANATWIFPAIGILFAAIILIFTIAATYESIGVISDKFVNLMVNNTWATSEEQFHLNLKKEYDKFNSGSEKLDVALLSSTVHYTHMIDPKVWDGQTDPGFGEGAEVSSLVPVDTSKTVDFYNWANLQIGTTESLSPEERGLVGALVSKHVNNYCVLKSENWESVWEDLSKWFSSLASRAFNILPLSVDLITPINGSMRDGILTLYKFHTTTKIEGVGNIFDYISHVTRSLQAKRVVWGYETGHAFDFSGIDPNLVCNADERIEVGFTDFNDYEKYREYLRVYYIPDKVLYCPNCEYYNVELSEEREEKLIENIIDDIFSQRDFYAKLMGDEILGEGGSGNPIYIPGMSSFPIGGMNASNWTSHISRGYAMGTARCYVGGQYTGKDNCDHPAIDFAYPSGTGVLSIAEGIIVSIQYLPNTYGNVIKIGHDLDDDGKYDYYSLYAHLLRVNVQMGQNVGGGQKIGEVGSSGNSSGPHLHFEIRNKDNITINPSGILEGMARGNSVLDKNNENNEVVD